MASAGELPQKSGGIRVEIVIWARVGFHVRLRSTPPKHDDQHHGDEGNCHQSNQLRALGDHFKTSAHGNLHGKVVVVFLLE